MISVYLLLDRTELSQVYYGLAKVQFLKKSIVLHLKSIALFLKINVLYLKKRRFTY